MHGERRNQRGPLTLGAAGCATDVVVPTAPRWRRALGRDLTALLALKAAALWVLWALCFSAAHRVAADANAASRALGMPAAAASAAARTGGPEQAR
jgi:hypothetical protein